MSGDKSGLARGEWAVLALLAERPSHGWALGNELAPETEIGQIWSGDRQRVYRAIRTLSELGLIEQTLVEPGAGAHRTIFRATAEGRKAVREWLTKPVEHMRDAQTTFVLKLVLLQRAGLEATGLLNAQRGLVVAGIASLGVKVHEAAPGRELHLRLRLETTRALLTFIDSLSNETAQRTAPRRRQRAAN